VGLICERAAVVVRHSHKPSREHSRQEPVPQEADDGAVTLLDEADSVGGRDELDAPPPPDPGVLTQGRLDPLLLLALAIRQQQGVAEASGKDDAVLQRRAAALAEVRRHRVQRVAGHAHVAPGDARGGQRERRPEPQRRGEDVAHLAPVDRRQRLRWHLGAPELGQHEPLHLRRALVDALV